MMILCPKAIAESNLLGGADQSERVVFGSRNVGADCIGSLKVSYAVGQRLQRSHWSVLTC